MGKKRTLAERAKWKRIDDEMRTYSHAGALVILRHVSGKTWCVSSVETNCYRKFRAPHWDAAKARAIELVQERIRELYAAWEC